MLAMYVVVYLPIHLSVSFMYSRSYSTQSVATKSFGVLLPFTHCPRLLGKYGAKNSKKPTYMQIWHNKYKAKADHYAINFI